MVDASHHARYFRSPAATFFVLSRQRVKMTCAWAAALSVLRRIHLIASLRHPRASANKGTCVRPRVKLRSGRLAQWEKRNNRVTIRLRRTWTRQSDRAPCFTRANVYLLPARARLGLWRPRPLRLKRGRVGPPFALNVHPGTAVRPSPMLYHTKGRCVTRSGSGFWSGRVPCRAKVYSLPARARALMAADKVPRAMACFVRTARCS